MILFFVKNRVSAWIIVIVCWLSGLYLFSKIGLSELADIETPGVSVEIEFPGASPDLVETEILIPLENTLSSVNGVQSMFSTASQGMASVYLEFPLDSDLNSLSADVHSAVQRALPEFPDDVKPPVVLKASADDPVILWAALHVDEVVDEVGLMNQMLKQIKPQLTLIDGVSEVLVGGTVKPQVNVRLNPEKMASLALSPNDIIESIKSEHFESPGGHLITDDAMKEYSVRTLGQVTSAAALALIPIHRRSSGEMNFRATKVGDVANVVAGLGEVRNYSRLNHKKAISIGFKKQRGANLFKVTERIKAQMTQVQKVLGPQFNFITTYDSSLYVQKNVQNLLMTIFLCLLATAVIIFLFLSSARLALITMLIIPTVLLGVFPFLQIFDFTLNNFTLLALAVAVGIMVDDSIVIIENIVRKRESGCSAFEAATQGTSELVGPTISTSLVLICMFLPIYLIKSPLGQSFWEFSVVFCVALILSTFFSLTFIPMAYCQFCAKENTRLNRKGFAIQFAQGSWYARFLRGVLHRKGFVALASFALFVLMILQFYYSPKELLPYTDVGEIKITTFGPPGSSIHYTDTHLLPIEETLGATPGIQNILAVAGDIRSNDVNRGEVYLRLDDYGDRMKNNLSQQVIATKIREDLKKIEGVKVLVNDSGSNGLSSGSAPVDFYIMGPQWDRLIHLSNSVLSGMGKSRLFTDFDAQYANDLPEVKIVPDRRKMALHEVSVRELTWTITALIGGLKIGKINTESFQQEINVRIGENQITHPSELYNIQVRNLYGNLLPITAFVDIYDSKINQFITRIDRQKAIRVTSQLSPGVSLSQGVERLHEIFDELLPNQYSSKWAGQSQEAFTTQEQVSTAAMIGVVAIFVVLAFQFNSFLIPLVILFSIPLGLIGGLTVLWLSSVTINVYSAIGLILVIGIAVKNSILLVDAIVQKQNQHSPLPEVIERSCLRRFQPIMMTALSTIVGTVPILFSSSMGYETRQPMAIALIGGIVFAVFFTLSFLPGIFLFSRSKSI